MATVQRDGRLDAIPAQRHHDGGDSAVRDLTAPAGAVRGAQTGAMPAVAEPAAAADAVTDPSVRERGLRTTLPATLPTQRSAPPVEHAAAPPIAPVPSTLKPSRPPVPVRAGRRAPVGLIVSTIALVVVVLVTSIVVRLQNDARAAEVARAQVRVAIDARAERADHEFLRDRGRAVTTAATTARSTGALGAAASAVAAAQASLAAAPNAGDAPRAALQAAIDATTAAVATTGSGTNLMTLETAVASLAGPQQGVVDAQAAWQAAEDARIAAEQAAAAQAAADQAAAQAAARPHATTTRAPRTTSTRTTSSTPATASVPAAPPAAATAGDEFSAGSIGAELNAYRASQGLGALNIVRSAARVDHAGQMAASDSIWHSSNRTMAEIVGRVMPVSASAMINAYANSPGHQAIMVGDYSTAYIGAVTSGGWLYTSIQFS